MIRVLSTKHWTELAKDMKAIRVNHVRSTRSNFFMIRLSFGMFLCRGKKNNHQVRTDFINARKLDPENYTYKTKLHSITKWE